MISKIRPSVLVVALLLAVIVATFWFATIDTAQAQAERDEIQSFMLTSDAPGQLVISWDISDPAPANYRIMWTRSDLGFLSWRNSNEDHRGNEYPNGDVGSITINNLTPGEIYKARMLAYYDDRKANTKSRSPWTDIVEQRVKANAPAVPTNLIISKIDHNEVTISWDDPQNEDIIGYSILRGDNAENLSTITPDTGDTNTIYTDSTVTADTTYHYGVVALSEDGESSQSAIVASTPAAPKKQDEPIRIVPKQNANSPATGTLNITGDPFVGSSLTATHVDLADPDGINNATIMYHWKDDVLLAEIATNATPVYILTDDELGHQVRVFLRFDDNAGNKESIKSDWFPSNGVIVATNTASTGTPTIGGTAQVGQTLTASINEIEDMNGLPSVFNYQWLRYNADGNTLESNIGTNANTYTLTDAEEGKKIRVEITFIDNDSYSEGPLTSVAYPRTGTVKPAPPPLSITQIEDRQYSFTKSDFNKLPSGTVRLEKLTITSLPDNGWLAQAVTVTLESNNRQRQSQRIYSGNLPLTMLLEQYQLNLTFFPEDNEHGTPYAGFKFKVNNSADEHTMAVNITPVNDSPYGPVYISGNAQVGQILAVSPSSFRDLDGVDGPINYQWKRFDADGANEVDIGTNSNSYALVDADFGKKIKVKINYTDNDNTRESITSKIFPSVEGQVIGETALVSIAGLGGDSRVDLVNDRHLGQIITTGINTTGYTLSRVMIISEDSQDDDIDVKVCGVDSNNQATADCIDLIAPSSFDRGPLSFTAPPNTVLPGGPGDGRINYMVVVSRSDSVGTTAILDAARSDGTSGRPVTGFSIRNKMSIFTTGNTWADYSERKRMRIAIFGMINP